MKPPVLSDVCGLAEVDEFIKWLITQPTPEFMAAVYIAERAHHCLIHRNLWTQRVRDEVARRQLYTLKELRGPHPKLETPRIPILGSTVEPERPPQPDWQQRVIEEEAELGSRILKLLAFLESPNSQAPRITEADRQLLVEQHQYMSMYRSVLLKRIARFQ